MANEEHKEEQKEESKAFDCLAVTNVQVFPFKDNLGSMKAMANVTLNDQLMIRGLKVQDGPYGLFVSYPYDPFYTGAEYRSLVVPVTRQLREHIENCVLEKYLACIG